MAGSRGGETGARPGAELRSSISWLQWIEARQVPIHPIADGAECIVIEGVHARRVEALLWRPAVPPLPDRRGAIAHLEQPRWVAVLLQQLAGKLVVSVVGQRRHDQRGAKKTGGQVRI